MLKIVRSEFKSKSINSKRLLFASESRIVWLEGTSEILRLDFSPYW